MGSIKNTPKRKRISFQGRSYEQYEWKEINTPKVEATPPSFWYWVWWYLKPLRILLLIIFLLPFVFLMWVPWIG